MNKRGKIVRVDHPIVQRKINESLDLSIKEGAVESISNGFGVSYLSPFALFLNATTSQMGILHAIISLLPCIVQTKVVRIIKKFSRKKIIIASKLAKVFLFIPVIATGILFYLGFNHMAWIFIAISGLIHTSMAIVNPTWFSWMGSLVPANGRGNYFSKRNIKAGLFGVITMVVAAGVLDLMKKAGTYINYELEFTLLAFILLFLLSAFSGLWSTNIIRKQYEPTLKLKKRDYFSFGDFMKKIRETPFGKFSLYRMLLAFATNIAAPFFAVYMLRDLGLSYFWYILITVSSVIFRLGFLPMLGRVSDRFGNIKLTRISSWMIAIIPLLWVVSVFITDPLALRLYLLFVPSIVAGIAWGGYDLAVNNYVFDAVSAPKRSFGISYMNLMVGFGAFVGASLGSLLALINIQFMNIILFIFLVSSFFRLIFSALGAKMLHEVRHVEKFSYEYIIKQFQPMRGVVQEVHSLDHLASKNVHHI